MAMDAVTSVQHDHGGKRRCAYRNKKLGTRVARCAADRAAVKCQRLCDCRCAAEPEERA